MSGRRHVFCESLCWWYFYGNIRGKVLSAQPACWDERGFHLLDRMKEGGMDTQKRQDQTEHVWRPTLG